MLAGLGDAGAEGLEEAASMTVAVLANLDAPFGTVAAGLSSSLKTFMDNLSHDLEDINKSEFAKIENGSMGGPRLDDTLVHAEQTEAQTHLDAYAQADPAGYNSLIPKLTHC